MKCHISQGPGQSGSSGCSCTHTCANTLFFIRFLKIWVNLLIKSKKDVKTLNLHPQFCNSNQILLPNLVILARPTYMYLRCGRLFFNMVRTKLNFYYGQIGHGLLLRHSHKKKISKTFFGSVLLPTTRSGPVRTSMCVLSHLYIKSNLFLKHHFFRLCLQRSQVHSDVCLPWFKSSGYGLF